MQYKKEDGMTCRRQRNRLLRSEPSKGEMRSLTLAYLLVFLVFFIHVCGGIAIDTPETKLVNFIYLLLHLYKLTGFVIIVVR